MKYELLDLTRDFALDLVVIGVLASMTFTGHAVADVTVPIIAAVAGVRAGARERARRERERE